MILKPSSLIQCIMPSGSKLSIQESSANFIESVAIGHLFSLAVMANPRSSPYLLLLRERLVTLSRPLKASGPIRLI